MTLQINKIIRTLRYAKKNPTLATLRNSFFLFGEGSYDISFYALFKLFQQCHINLDINRFTNEKNIIETLKENYLNAIASADIPVNQVKKLRLALFDFATKNNLRLYDLLQGSEVSLLRKKATKNREKIETALKSKWVKQLCHQFNFYEDVPERAGSTDLAYKLKIEQHLQQLQKRIATQLDRLNESQINKITDQLRQVYFHHKLTEDLSLLNHAFKEKNLHQSLKKYHQVKKTLETLSTRRGRIIMALRSRLPSFLWDHTMDKDVYQIVNYLAYIGLHKESAGLIKLFLSGTPKNDCEARAHCEKLLNLLYGIFNSLSVRIINVPENPIDQALSLLNEERLIAPHDVLKKLKKLIHRFAENNQFDKKLFNIRKSIRRNMAVDVVSDKLFNHPERTYAYLSDHVNIVTEKKRKLRARKKLLDRISFSVSIGIALSEGLVAAVFFGWLLVPSLIIVGVAGFVVNYVLYRLATYDALKQFFVTGLYRDTSGNEISLIKKIAITLFPVISSFAAACVFGIFSFSTAVSAFTGLLALASIPFPPLVIVLALALAIINVVAHVKLFYYAISNFIKNDDILKIGQYLKSSYYDVWKMTAPLDAKAKALHYAKATAKCLFNGLFLAIGISACIVMTGITLGLGKTKAIEVLTTFTKLSPKIIELASSIFVDIVAMPVNSFLYWKGLLNTTHAFKGMLQSITQFTAKVVLHPKKTMTSMAQAWKSFKENELRSIHLVGSWIKKTVLILLTGPNGDGQAHAPLNDMRCIDNINAMTNLPRPVAAKTAFTVAFAGSSTVNALAINEATKLPQPVYYKNKITFFSTLREIGEDRSTLDEETQNELTNRVLSL